MASLRDAEADADRVGDQTPRTKARNAGLRGAGADSTGVPNTDTSLFQPGGAAEEADGMAASTEDEAMEEPIPLANMVKPVDTQLLVGGFCPCDRPV